VTLSISDACFFAGDTESLLEHLYSSLNILVKNPNIANQVSQQLLDTALSIEALDFIRELLVFMNSQGITANPYELFRLKQLQAEPAALKVLSSLFDNYDQTLEVVNKASTQVVCIDAYELGGLGDYVEAICLLLNLVQHRLPYLHVNIRLPTDFSIALNGIFEGTTISFTQCSWEARRVPGAIHLLTLSAIARIEYGLTPQGFNHLSSKYFSDPVHCSSKVLELTRRAAGQPLLIWNSQSQPKLNPKSLRRSYYHRSLHHSYWQLHLNILTGENFVIDISDYPAGWPQAHDQPNYLRISAKKFSFAELMYLCLRSSKLVTIDSLLAHLGASLACSVDLLLAVGHEQRWFIDFGLQESMYTRHCKVYKQKSLHGWGQMSSIPRLKPINMGI